MIWYNEHFAGFAEEKRYAGNKKKPPGNPDGLEVKF
jgi:hypothetical protein